MFKIKIFILSQKNEFTVEDIHQQFPDVEVKVITEVLAELNYFELIYDRGNKFITKKRVTRTGKELQAGGG